MNIRAKRINTLNRLNEVLGNKYTTKYDVCESGMSEIYLNLKNGTSILVKKFENSILDGEIVVNDFAAPQGMLAYYHTMNLI